MSGPAFDKENKINNASSKASERTEKFKSDFNRGFYSDDQE